MSDTAAPTERRKFNIFLAIGILLLPIVFVWFLLRRGHSTTARIVGFGWTALFVLVALTANPSTEHASSSRPEASASASAPLSPEEIAARAEQEKQREAAERARTIARSPERFLTLQNANGVRGGFDTVFLLSGAITNSAEVDIRDPTIVCELFGASGTQVGSVRETLFEIVPAHGRKAFSELNMGFMGSTQVATYRCDIVDAETMP